MTGCTAHRSCGLCTHNDKDSMLEILEPKKGDRPVCREVDTFEIVFVEKGTLKAARRGCPDMVVECGNMFLLPPGALVTYAAEEDCRVLICRLNNEVRYCRSMDLTELHRYSTPEGFDIYSLALKGPLEYFAEGLSRCAEDGLRCRPYLASKYSELLFLIRGYYSDPELSLFFRPMLGKDMAFRAFVFRNLSRCNSVGEMAAKYSMCERAFRRKFAEEMGFPPHDYILENRKRMILHELKYTDKPIKQIYWECGFRNRSHFSSFCKKYLGAYPSEVRK